MHRSEKIAGIFGEFLMKERLGHLDDSEWSSGYHED